MNSLFMKFMENFELILVVAVVICFFFYILDSKYRKERKYLWKVFKNRIETDADRNLYSQRLVVAKTKLKLNQVASYKNAQKNINLRNHLSKDELLWAVKPVYATEKLFEFFGGMFWILFIIFVFRSFLFEPFKIPSGSMEPTLQNGDLILVNKYSYGVRLPVLNKKILDVQQVQRGDAVVFKYPENPKINYIKRVIALPDDEVLFSAGRFVINGKALEYQNLNKTNYGHDNGIPYEVFTEKLDNKIHQIQFAQNPNLRMTELYAQLSGGKFKIPEGKSFKVPKNSYLAIGDNRDNSTDSRFWGFVPEENLVGKALFIWFNTDCMKFKGHCNRIGRTIK